jgi:hypothetical protein
LETENAELKSKLAQVTSSIRSGETERDKFFQGASWASRQCVQACDSGMQKMGDLRVQYDNRIRECKEDHFLRLRVAEWLMDSSARVAKEMRDDNQAVLEKAIRDQASAT